jgi:hypothetical protein
MRRTLLGIAVLAGFVFMGCSLTDSLEQTANIAKVKFSGVGWSAQVKSESVMTMAFDMGAHGSRYVLDHDVFLRMSYKVRADNSGNAGKAAFGSEAVKPVLNLYIQDVAKNPIQVTVEPFEIDSGAVDTVAFDFDIPFGTIYNNSPDLISTILKGADIPYRLTASLKFQVTAPGGVVLGASTSELELVNSGIPTRPSDGVVTAILGYL